MSAVGEFLTINGDSPTIEFPYARGNTMQLTQADVSRFWSKVQRNSESGCWEWQAALLTSGGYGAFRLNGVTVRAHRVAFYLTNGDLNPDLEVLHLCSNPKCCNPLHLKQDTHAANLRQAGFEGKMGRHFGANSKVKFSEEQLKDILTSPGSARALGRKYGVDHKTIRRIQKEFSICQSQD